MVHQRITVLKPGKTTNCEHAPKVRLEGTSKVK